MQAQDLWQKTNGPFGGNTILSICFAPNGNMYAAAHGMHKSIDQGNSWMKLSQGPYGVQSIATNQMGDVFVATSAGVYRSMDNGNTWVLLINDLNNKNLRKILINQNGDIFAGTASNGIYRSTDNGNNWTHISLTIYGITTLALNGDGDIFAGTQPNGAYRTTDNGDTWMPINNGLTNIELWEIATNQDGDIFAATNGGVFRSTNNGDNWIDVNNGLVGYIVISIAIAPNGDLYAGLHHNNGIYRSSDNGENWSYSGLNSIQPWSLTVNQSGVVFAAGDIMYRSIDYGSNWSPVGLIMSTVSSFAKDQSSKIYAITSRFFSTADKGNNWNEISLPPYRSAKSMAVNQNNDIWLGTDWGVKLSSDNGITWQDKGLPQKIVKSILLSQNEYILLGTESHGIFYSTDYGNSWIEKNNGIPLFTNISTLVENQGGDIFVGTAEDGIFRSLDTANTWVLKNNGLTNLKINSIGVNNQGIIFTATQGGGVFRSTDNGENWIQLNSGLTNLFVRSLTISQYGQVFVATYDGIFSSIDNGENWISMNEGLFNRHLNSMIIDQDGYIFLGALISGAYRSINSITSVEPRPISVNQLTLNQNYPNPFNPSTTIRYTTPNVTLSGVEGSRVQLKVFDVLGNEVATLVDEYKPAGSYEVEFNTSTINHQTSSGVYFYQLRAGSFVQTKKMILIK